MAGSPPPPLLPLEPLDPAAWLQSHYPTLPTPIIVPPPLRSAVEVNDDDKDSSTRTVLIRVAPDDVGHVIGKKGAFLQKLKVEAHVTVTLRSIANGTDWEMKL